MNFEWDEGKARANLEMHGVSFKEAQTVFDDPLYVDFYDPDHSYDEHRYIIIGLSKQGRLLLVSYTERDGTTRLISSREVTLAERKA
ncbi:MAG: hypothetical protein DMF68_08145 [Acidobacteria bacterium]|nr:MAG: hypothetical protein DMF68_08145 [Acidobacteriota bacterium]